jgi:parallel beta-helix repeat protein
VAVFAVGLIATALGAIGAPKLVWIIVLIIGALLLALAVVQWIMSKRRKGKKKGGGRTTDPKDSGGSGKVSAQSITQGDGGTIIGKQTNHGPSGPLLSGNKSFGSGDHGFYFGRGVNPRLENNEAYDSGGDGFHFADDDPQDPPLKPPPEAE